MIDATFLEACAPSVSSSTLAQVIEVESAGDPLALNINGVGRSARKSRREIIAQAERALARGLSIDVGLMQINSQHFARFHLSVSQALDPCTNVKVGAAILTINYVTASRVYGPGQIALQHALSAYNTGDFSRGIANGYVGRYFVPSHRSRKAPVALVRNTEPSVDPAQ